MGRVHLKKNPEMVTNLLLNMVYFGENFVEVNSVKVVCEIRIMMYTPLKFQARDEVLGLPGGAVVN